MNIYCRLVSALVFHLKWLVLSTYLMISLVDVLPLFDEILLGHSNLRFHGFEESGESVSNATVRI
jgi:hypothetical protein